MSVLGRIVNEPIKLSVAGRTDAGVHARGQVTSFTTTTNLAADRIRDAVNAILGPELVVRQASDAPDGFDARFSATAREYRYAIAIGDVADPFTARYVWHRPDRLHVPSMRRAGVLLLGERDFASFCRDPGRGRSTIRDLQRIAVRRIGDQVTIAFRAALWPGSKPLTSVPALAIFTLGAGLVAGLTTIAVAACVAVLVFLRRDPAA